MNDIQIFKDERFKETSQEKQFQFLGVLSYILADAIKEDDKETAWLLLNVASQFGHPMGCDAFNALYMAAAMEVTRNFLKDKPKDIAENIRKFWEGLKND